MVINLCACNSDAMKSLSRLSESLTIFLQFWHHWFDTENDVFLFYMHTRTSNG